MSEIINIILVCESSDISALERSLLSLVTQAGDFSLRIHVKNIGPHAAANAPVLAGWQARMGNADTVFYCTNVWLTYQTQPHLTAHAALRDAMGQICEDGDSFTSWLHPGDILLPGALAHISDLARRFTADHLAWVQGAAGHLDEGQLIAGSVLRAPTALIAQGVCDDHRWPALAQGGMFIRAGLWRKAQASLAFEGPEDITPWLLWQRLARQALFVQSTQVMGVFVSCAKEPSAHLKIRRRRRMQRVAPEAEPRDTLQRILRQGPLLHHVITNDATGAPTAIIAMDVTAPAYHWARQTDQWHNDLPEPASIAQQRIATAHGAPMPLKRPSEKTPNSPPHRAMPDTTIFADLPAYRLLLRTINAQMPDTNKLMQHPLYAWLPALRHRPVWQASRIWAWDQGWDDTDHTEWAALRALQEMGDVPQGTSYVGFPWAALIEARAETTAQAQRLRHDFQSFATTVPRAARRITTCQHPDLIAHLDYFKHAGVTDVFWPYTTPEAVQAAAAMGICLHTIPQSARAAFYPADQTQRRKHLFCKVDADTVTLRQSTFALCPAAPQDHPAALLHAIAAGAIPVVPTDADFAPLVGHDTLWRNAVERWDFATKTQDDLSTHLRILRKKAEKDAEYQLAPLPQALAQLQLSVGPETLGCGIHALMARHADAYRALPAFPAPRQISRHIRIYHLGPRAARSPLGYAPFARLAENRILRVESPAEADIVMTGWNRDLAENPELLAHAFESNPGLRCMVISEEPLWDTLWSDGFAARDRPFVCNGREHSYRYLNHMNSDIFAFTHIPYFLLTSDDYVPRYISMLRRYAHISARAMLTKWQTTIIAAAFVAEHRDAPEFDFSDPARDIQGLSGYRTRVAQHAKHPKIWRMGQGWADGMPPRQTLPDWHLDKLARLQGNVRLCSAYENTHMRGYISEKVFDAFAVGAMPVCYAAPDHRLHELIAPYAMINTYDQPAETAAAWIDWFIPEMANAESWLETAARLRTRLACADAVAMERQRIATETLREIDMFIQTSL
ncbi:hypothetical protein ROG8370_02393 [Roseovarius gaetbuli]|uniref:Glycosyltransferase family 10 (Fucosyltransferase) n=1 Tax=Roseovarius gaetbuli TaxID=1356575 RepID=A0A1X6ZJ08_9RHOB|nr:hypothetical protein [Roseovarius gaetbuli]SLN53000.1 hypothetical protein ROG8370_02393 [Roseovarius gaetbuli]